MAHNSRARPRLWWCGFKGPSIAQALTDKAPGNSWGRSPNGVWGNGAAQGSVSSQVQRSHPHDCAIPHLYFGDLVKDRKGMLLQVLCRVSGRDTAYLRSQRYGFAWVEYII